MIRRPRPAFTLAILLSASALFLFRHAPAGPPPSQSEEAILASAISDDAQLLLKRGHRAPAAGGQASAFYAVDLEVSARERDGQGAFVSQVTRLLHCDAKNVNIVKNTAGELVLDFHFTPGAPPAEESLVRITAFRIERKPGDAFWKVTASGSGAAYEPFIDRLEEALKSKGKAVGSLEAAHWTSFGLAEDPSPLAGITVNKEADSPASCGDVYRLRWHDHGDYERIVLDLAAFADPAKAQAQDPEELAVPGTYRVDYERYPCRVVFDLVARGFSASADIPDFAGNSRLIRELHRIPVLDDSTVLFALVLNAPAEIEVFDLHGPARIVVDIRPAPQSKTEPPAKFSLRSAAIEGGETIGSLAEQMFELKPRNLRVLRTASGEYCVEEGVYDTAEEAGRRAKALGRLGVALAVEKRALLDAPESLGTHAGKKGAPSPERAE